MKLIDLNITGFGKLNNECICFSEGTNLISGRNEAGKSTVYACIRAMFYGMTRAKGVAALTDTYSHYKPWFAKNYGATLRVEDNGHIYSITRDFLKDPVGCTVYDETIGEPVPFADRFVAGLLLNMSEETYDNTISISRLRPDANGNLSGELKKYIINMDTTGSHALNCARARAHLTEQKRKLAEGISPDAAKEYAQNCSELKRLEKSLHDSNAVTRISTQQAAAVIGAAATTTIIEESEAEAEAAANKAAAEKEAAAQRAIAEKEAAEKKAIAEKEAAEKAAAARAADEERASINTEMQCLDAEIIKAREILRSHSVYSAGQVTEALEGFYSALEEYKKKSGKAAIVIFRVLYIASFVLAILDFLAIAYVFGGNKKFNLLLGFIIIGIVLTIVGAVFLALCIIFKNRSARNSQTFGEVLERYTGYDEVTPERIDRVKEKLEELKRLAVETEANEKKLAQLSQKLQELAPAAQSEEAATAESEEQARTELAAQVKSVLAANAAASVATSAAASMAEDPELSRSEIDIEAVNEAINRINEIKSRNVGLKELLRKNDSINEELDAIDMALEKLDEIADTMKDSLGVHLNAKASEYIKEITKGAYDSLSVDDDLNVFMNTKEKMVPIEMVSNGTSDQIYMALRMAGARLVQNGEDKLPIIFDDSFVNYDDERLAATLTWLVKAYAGQVIIFTCQNREEELLKENSLTFNPIHL